jgi:hypothetical protein
VHVTLDRGADIQTTLSIAAPLARTSAPHGAQHMRDMREVCAIA